GQMQLGGPPAPGATQRVIVRLDLAGPRRWLRLQIRPPTGSGGVLVRPGDGGVHAHIPTDQPQRVGPALQPAQNPRPDALPLPTPEQAIDRLPMPVTVRHIPPRRPSAHPPPDPVNELPLTPLRRPTRLPTPGQQRLQHRPLRVAQVEPPRHRYPGHEVSVLMAVLVDEPSTGDLATCRSPTHPADQLTTNHHPLLKHGLALSGAPCSSRSAQQGTPIGAPMLSRAP